MIICYPAAQFIQVLYLSTIFRYFQFPLHYIYSVPLVGSLIFRLFSVDKLFLVTCNQLDAVVGGTLSETRVVTTDQDQMLN